MANEPFPCPRCFITIPDSREYRRVHQVVDAAIAGAGFESIRSEDLFDTVARLSPRDAVVGELATADFVVAEVSESSPSVFFELGLARAMAKPTVLLLRSATTGAVREAELRGQQVIVYETSTPGLRALRTAVERALQQLRLHPRQTDLFTRASTPFFVDWERLSREDRENLCRELLTQMGYRRRLGERGAGAGSGCRIASEGPRRLRISGTLAYFDGTQRTRRHVPRYAQRPRVPPSSGTAQR
jgi:hypothetical protein